MKQKQGITIIEVLVTVVISSIILIILGRLLLNVMTTQRRLQEYTNLNNNLDTIFTQLDIDIKYADKVTLLPGPKTGDTLVLEYHDIDGTLTSTIKYEQNNNQLIKTVTQANGITTSTPYTPQKNQITTLEFQAQQNTQTDPLLEDYLPLIHTTIGIKTPGVSTENISLERELLTSNLKTTIDLGNEGGNAPVQAFPTRNPTPTPGGAPSPTPTPPTVSD